MKTNVLLAVDDKPDNLYVLQSLIAQHLPDCEVLTASSAEEGLAAVAQSDLDGVLVDVQMPGMSGIEMCRQLKSNERTAHVPVILITAHRADAKLKAEGLEAGADDLLTKPIDNIELVAKIKVMLRIKRTEDELRTANARLEELAAERTRGWRESKEELRRTYALVQAFLKGTGDAVYVKDSQGRYLMANESAARAMGRSKDDVVGKNDTELFPQEVACTLMAADREIMNTGETIIVEETTRVADTTTTWLTSKGPYRDDDGKLLGTVGISRDITEQKLIEKDLEKQRYYLARAQDIGKIGTWELNIAKNELIWTDESYRIFGVPPGTELTYEAFLNCVHPDDREYVDGEWKAALHQEPYDIEHRILVDGNTRWVREKAELEFDENGDCIRGIGFTQDITERKRAEEELAKHREHLEERVRDRTEELRTVVNAMAGRENRMIELKGAIKKLRVQLEDADMTPVADDPLVSGSDLEPEYVSMEAEDGTST